MLNLYKSTLIYEPDMIATLDNFCDIYDNFFSMLMIEKEERENMEEKERDLMDCEERNSLIVRT